MICALANASWLAGCLPEAWRFRRATVRVREEQERVLLGILRANASSEFGRLHGFSSIRTVHEYRERVPLRDYAELEPWIARIARGEPGVLTTEPVRLLQPTSGSTAARKLVPCTRSLLAEFQRGIRPWIADLFSRRPALIAGAAYWAVSPAPRAVRPPEAAVPIGFDDDAAYVGGWQRRLVRLTQVDSRTRHTAGDDLDGWRRSTLRALVRRGDLRLVSVWNPTFLSLLVERLPEWGDALARDLAGAPIRRRALESALAAPTPGERHARLWPKLRVISCWADAAAGAPAAHLASLFPHAEVQPKGLIATEGFVSFPLVGRPGGALAVRSHFLEFVPLDRPADVPHLAHEIEEGRRYAVVLTTGGGLYRYRLEDVVEIVGRIGACPLVRFIGRAGGICDWFGEKLNEAFVARALAAELAAAEITSPFAMLACETRSAPPSYVLYIETAAPDERLVLLGVRVEAVLRTAFHYDHARSLGQLGPLRVFRCRHAAETYLARAIGAGQRAGEVKPPVLDRGGDWSEIFDGCPVPASDVPPQGAMGGDRARRD